MIQARSEKKTLSVIFKFFLLSHTILRRYNDWIGSVISLLIISYAYNYTI